MIQIRQKSLPFSKEYASRAPIPNTNLWFEAWPTKFIVFNDKKRVEFDLECSGPIKNFTLHLDLEKGRLLCHFMAREGFFSWAIERVLTGVEFRLKRAADSGVCVNGRNYKRFDRFIVPLDDSCKILTSNERLCLGSHKAQDVQNMFKRFDLRELLPLYFRLGQYFTPSGSILSLEELKTTHLCQVSSLFYFSDSIHQLLGLQHKRVDCSFYANAYCFIRDMFFKQEGENLLFMSGFIPFNSGRMVNLQFSAGKLSFIFRKKRVLRIVIDPTQDATIRLCLPQKFKQFRVLKSLRKKGQILSSNDTIELKKSTRLYLDKFYF